MIVGVHLPGVAYEADVIRRLEASGKRVVDLDAHPDVIVTADGVVENGFVRALKDEVDEALPNATRVIVIRNVGNAPLGPTYDVYLDVEMRPGRDFYVGAWG